MRWLIVLQYTLSSTHILSFPCVENHRLSIYLGRLQETRDDHVAAQHGMRMFQSWETCKSPDREALMVLSVETTISGVQLQISLQGFSLAVQHMHTGPRIPLEIPPQCLSAAYDSIVDKEGCAL